MSAPGETRLRAQHYDAFISHCAADSKVDFAVFLKHELERAGVRCFFDERDPAAGDALRTAFLEAMEAATYGVVLLTHGFFRKEWCMKELQTFVRRGRVVPVFLSEIGAIERGRAEAIERKVWLEFQQFSWSEVDYVNTAQSALTFTGVRVDGFWDTAIRRVTEAIVRLLGMEKGGPRRSEDELLVGLDAHVLELKALLGVSSPNGKQLNAPLNEGGVTVGIVGMAGVGKTTLAKAIYDDVDTRRWFEGGICWLEVGMNPAPARICNLQMCLLRELGNLDVEIESPEAGRAQLKSMLRGAHRVLICLDTSEESDAEAVAHVSDLPAGSRLLLTSRSRGDFGLKFDLNVLSRPFAWELFCWHAFQGRVPESSLVTLAERAVELCGGHPLALKLVATHVAGSVNTERALRDFLDPQSEATLRLSPIIRQSYDSLPSLDSKDAFVLIAGLWPRTSGFVELHDMLGNLAAVFDGGSDGGLRARGALKVLNVRSLLRTSGEGLVQRIEVHDLLAEVAEGLVMERDEFLRYHEPEIPRRFTAMGRVEHVRISSASIPFDSLLQLSSSIVSLVVDSGVDVGNGRASFAKLSSCKLLSIDGVVAIKAQLPPNLLCLRLRGGLFRCLPAGVECLRSLTVLDLHDCKALASLPRKLGRSLPNLRALELGQCQALKALPEDLGRITGLTALSLDGCAGLRALFESLGMLTALTFLDLRMCTSLKALPGTLKQLTVLQTLLLNGCTGLMTVPNSLEALTALTALTVLGLSGLAFKEGRFEVLEPLTRLQSLDCCNIDLSVVRLPSLLQSLGEMSMLASLDLSQNFLGDDGALVLVEMAGVMRGLTSLNLLGTGVMSEGAKALAAVLGTGAWPALKVVELLLPSEQAGTEFLAWLESHRNLIGATVCTWFSDPAQTARATEIVSRNRNRFERETQWNLINDKRVQPSSVRVFFCGQAGVGKTSLRGSIESRCALVEAEGPAETKEEALDIKQTISTRGIEVREVDCKGISLMLWDLAGQFEFHVFHSAFLADVSSIPGNATACVLVVRSSLAQPAPGESGLGAARKLLRYWLRFVASGQAAIEREAGGERLEVLVVVNRWDGELGNENDSKVWAELVKEERCHFSRRLDLNLIVPSSFDVREPLRDPFGTFMEELEGKLSRRLSGLGKCVPLFCLSLSGHVKVLRRYHVKLPLMTWADFRAEVAELEFAGERERSLDWEAKLAYATEYLHAVGQIVYFAAKQLVVLDPDWICRRVVGELLLPNELWYGRDRPLSQFNGRVALEDLESWYAVSLDGGCPGSIIVDLLEWLSLCVKLPQEEPGAGKGRVIIPALLRESDLAEVGSQWMEGGQGFCAGRRLSCRDAETTALAPSFFHRLQAKVAAEETDRCSIGKGSVFLTLPGRFELFEYDDARDCIDVLIKGFSSKEDADAYAQVMEALNRRTRSIHTLCAEIRPGVLLRETVIIPWSSNGLKALDERQTREVRGLQSKLREDGREDAMLLFDGGRVSDVLRVVYMLHQHETDENLVDALPSPAAPGSDDLVQVQPAFDLRPLLPPNLPSARRRLVSVTSTSTFLILGAGLLGLTLWLTAASTWWGASFQLFGATCTGPGGDGAEPMSCPSSFGLTTEIPLRWALLCFLLILTLSAVRQLVTPWSAGNELPRPDEWAYDVFLSHTGAQKDLAKSLHAAMKRLKLNSFFDLESLQGTMGNDSIMVKAAQEAPVGVLLLSPEFFKRTWPLRELALIMDAGRFVPVWVGDGFDELKVHLKRKPCQSTLSRADWEGLVRKLEYATVTVMKGKYTAPFLDEVVFGVVQRAVGFCKAYGKLTELRLFRDRVHAALEKVVSDTEEEFRETKKWEISMARSWQRDLQALNRG